jgi:hypothetical protein
LATVAILSVSTDTSAQNISNVGCLLASNMVAQKVKEPKAKQVAEASAYYYLGRLDPAVTPEQLRQAFMREQKALMGKNAGVLMRACVGRIQERAAMVQRVSQQLQTRK